MKVYEELILVADATELVVLKGALFAFEEELRALKIIETPGVDEKIEAVKRLRARVQKLWRAYSLGEAFPERKADGAP